MPVPLRPRTIVCRAQPMVVTPVHAADQACVSTFSLEPQPARSPLKL